MNEFENGLDKKWDFEEIPFDSEVKIEKLKNFLKPEDTLIFYGGEPLLMIEKIKEIMDNVNCRFCIQTNGKLLDKLPNEYLIRLDKILVSLDGDKDRTDFNKGEGTYYLVLENVQRLRKNGFKGEIVARMTLAFPDVFEQVRHLIDLNIFDSIHWQIDAGFYKNDFNEPEFSKFVTKYNNSLSDLINYWVREMHYKKVLKLYPLFGIFESLYYNKEEKLRCGSGYANYTITTKGNLSACPIINSVKNFYCGSLDEGIKREIHCIEPCTKCSYYSICGGRCLYSNYAKLWPEEGQELICKTIVHLIEEIKRVIPEIKKLISEGAIKEEDFYYEKYFGPEIIP